MRRGSSREPYKSTPDKPDRSFMLKSHPGTLFTATFLSLAYIITVSYNLHINPMTWDAFGYYLYLPFTFIYNDISLHNFETVNSIISTYKNTPAFYQAMQLESGNWVFKYSSGMALLYSPFFFIAHLFAKLGGFAADGFSRPYQIAIHLGSLFYTLCGILFSAKILTRFFKDIISSLTLIVVFLGTNYFLHTSMHAQGAMPHNYLFTLYAVLIWCTIKWHEGAENNRPSIFYAVSAGLICGVMTVARPSEIVSVLIPLFWSVYDRNSLRKKVRLIRREKKHVRALIFSLTLVISIQLIYWKLISGSFLFDSYIGSPNEGFEFLRPFVFEVLLSFRKGWLIYTPAMIFALAGLLLLRKQKNAYNWSVWIYFLVNFYVVASWSSWWYADSFGQRALIPSYALLLIPVATFIRFAYERSRYLFVVVCILIPLFITLNLFQSWQYLSGILHTSNMTKAYYFKIFGKLSVKEEDKKLLLPGREVGLQETLDPTVMSELRKGSTRSVSFQKSDKIPSLKDPLYPGNCLRLYPPAEFSKGIKAPYKEITDKSLVWLKISADIYTIRPASELNTMLVAAFHHKNRAYQYRALNLNKLDIRPFQWKRISRYYLAPEIRNPKDEFKMYFYSQGGKDTIYYNNLLVEAWEPVKDY